MPGQMITFLITVELPGGGIVRCTEAVSRSDEFEDSRRRALERVAHTPGCRIQADVPEHLMRSIPLERVHVWLRARGWRPDQSALDEAWWAKPRGYAKSIRIDRPWDFVKEMAAGSGVSIPVMFAELLEDRRAMRAA